MISRSMASISAADMRFISAAQLGVEHVIVGVGTAAGYPERQPIRSPLRVGDCWEAGRALCNGCQPFCGQSFR